MKSRVFKIAIAAFVFALGTLGSNAQIGQGGDCLATGPGFSGAASSTCIYTQLTEEQKVILHDLFVAYRVEMDVLRTDMRATRIFAEKRVIREKMTELRLAHRAEVKALLQEWGIGG